MWSHVMLWISTCTISLLPVIELLSRARGIRIFFYQPFAGQSGERLNRTTDYACHTGVAESEHGW